MNFDFEKIEEQTEFSRRQLLKVLGAGMVVMANLPIALGSSLQKREAASSMPQNIAAWIHIGSDSRVTVLTGKVEVGQNARTSITQAVAEELRVAPSAVTVIMGDTDLVPFDMGTFGSLTTPTMIPQLRKAAATAREALIDLAAKKWKVAPASIKAANGHLTHGKLTASYGDITKGQKLDGPIPTNPKLTPSSEWTVLGKVMPKVNGRDFVTGKHKYSIDQTVPGMLFAKVLRPPTFGAKLTTVDTSAAAAMPEVKVFRDGDFIAVAAPTARQAEKALTAISADWQENEGPSYKKIFSLLRGETTINELSIPAGSTKSSATYTASYIAHVPLEPRVALAEWDGQKLTVKTGTQRPFGVRAEVANALGIPEKQVRVIVPDTGSGYGGKHTGDAAVEAARIAKGLGKPIKLLWTRAEEFTYAYFRPAGVDEISAAVDANGMVTGWSCDNFNSGSPGIETPYDVQNRHAVSHKCDSPLRQGSYRCLGSTFNNFARESHMDEIAHSLNLDPLEFRLKNLTANPRLAAVLKAAADKFGWGKEKPGENHGFGIACGADKGGFVATCVEVSVDPKNKAIKVIRQVTAFECGKILNPDGLANQINGAVIQGMGGALFEAIEFSNNRILNAHLSRYRVPRYTDLPHMDLVLIDRKDLPSAGAGEAGILSIAPAIGNAIFDATKVRLRGMPMKLPA